MAIQGKVGVPVSVQFALYGADGFTRLVGEAGNVASAVFRSTVNGGRELAVLAVAIGELADQPGEYVATFTPDVADRTYTIILRHPASSADVEETVQVWTATLSDLDAAQDAAAAGVLVGIEGGPWQTGAAVQVTLAWRDRALNLFSPSAVRRIELIAPDAVTILQAIEGAGILTPAFGKRRATFNAPAAVATHYVRVFYTALAGGVEAFAVMPADVLAAVGAVVAGIISVDELLRDYLAVIAGDDVGVALLRGPNGEELIPTRFIEAAIRRNAKNVERLLETHFAHTRYATHPELGDTPLVKGVDYDEEEDGYPWLSGGRTSFRSGKIVFRHPPLVSIQRARLIYGTRVLYQVPLQWVTGAMNRRMATTEVILDGSGTLVQKEQVAVMLSVLGDFYADAISRNVVPGFWCFDYTAGLDECPEDVKAAAAWRAVAEILSVAAVKANKLAVSSQSRSLDGVSRSQGVNDSQPGGRFSRLLALPHIQKWLDDKWLVGTLKPLVRRSAVVL